MVWIVLSIVLLTERNVWTETQNPLVLADEVDQGSQKQTRFWNSYLTKAKKKPVMLWLNSCLAMLYLNSYFCSYFIIH